MIALYQRYRAWVDHHTPDTTSTSPKTGRELESQRVKKGPDVCVAIVRWFGKK